MSDFIEIPSYLRAQSGEEITPAFLAWVQKTKQKLLKAFPPGERAFCRIVDKLVSRLPRKWKQRLWYTRQKWYIVAPGVVFFGDFAFQNLKLLVEVDGASHAGPVAQEKDEWRSRLISAWGGTRVARLTNARAIDGDFREIERWFLSEAVAACPYARPIWGDYDRLKATAPHIYKAEGTLTTYRQ